jgi:hypothetical protein
VAMTLRLGFLALAVLACGGSAAKDPEPSSSEAEATNEPEAASPDTPGFAPMESCAVPPESGYLCKSCVSAPVPHCTDQKVPDTRGTEPPACANPDCPLSLVAMNNFLPFESSPPLVLQGQCADGKTFRAELGLLTGTIRYARDGNPVGTVQYAQQITDCACGGQGHNGDVVCADPIAEVRGDEVLPNPLILPFADGKRASACLCAD